MWIQQKILLQARPRGFHLISQEIMQKLNHPITVQLGVAHIFIQHTSASLTINENADPTVRDDFENYFNHSVRENEPYYRHLDEGPDDMPAHIKSSILGSSLSIPLTQGHFNLGSWQGIYLCEHRNHAGQRRLIVTINGE